MSLVIIGDIHFKNSTEDIDWGYNQKGLLQFVKDINFTKEDTFIQLGDFSDKPFLNGGSNKNAGKVIQYLSDKCKEVYLLVGNHDHSKFSKYFLDTVDLYDNVKVIKDIGCYIINDKQILFLPYIEGLSVGGKYEEKVNEYLQSRDICQVTYILSHNFFKYNTIMDSPYLDLDLLNVKFESCIQGHVHKFEEFKNGDRPSDICIGSILPWRKDEINNKQVYIKINGDIGFNIIDTKYFSQFVKIDWNGDYVSVLDKDFVIVKCKCKKEEKYTTEQEIRKKYPKNLYEIEWEFEEVEKIEKIEVKSDDELVEKFFEENKYSKDVKDLFGEYYKC